MAKTATTTHDGRFLTTLLKNTNEEKTEDSPHHPSSGNTPFEFVSRWDDAPGLLLNKAAEKQQSTEDPRLGPGGLLVKNKNKDPLWKANDLILELRDLYDTQGFPQKSLMV